MKKSDLENNFYLFLLSKIPDLGTKTILRLLDKYQLPYSIYLKLLQEKRIDKKFIPPVKKEFASINENYISILDKNYPALLKNIYDPPLFLFYRGNIKLLDYNNLITFVGSRTTTNYHIDSVKNIIDQLKNTNLVIVSGLAKGIDSVCHRQALDNNLKTIAVLGSGLSDKVIYPKQNLSLALEIIKNNGLLLSEQSSNTTIRTYHFPKRNRILAGLSQATVVISGAAKSGTLITAQVALDEGREVLVLENNIKSYLGDGPRKLINDGANVINNAQDILKIYNI